MKRTKEMHYFC